MPDKNAVTFRISKQEDAGVGFVKIEVAAVAHGTDVKTGIKQVQDSMFNAADILVDR